MFNFLKCVGNCPELYSSKITYQLVLSYPPLPKTSDTIKNLTNYIAYNLVANILFKSQIA